MEQVLRKVLRMLMVDYGFTVEQIVSEFNVSEDWVWDIVDEMEEESIRESEFREDQFRDDVEADADTLASAGYGTDEDYGYYNDCYGDEGDDFGGEY